MTGKLIVLEPWVPDDQVERRVCVVGRLLEGDGDGIVLVVDEPLTWNGNTPAVLLIARARVVGADLWGATELILHCHLFQGIEAPSVFFVAQVVLDEPLTASPV